MLSEGGGMIPFTDKASPELIREKAHMSKNEFKRAIGHLLKENRISIEENRIVLL
jgi:predicted RNA-binding protein (virulence factor B family)